MSKRKAESQLEPGTSFCSSCELPLPLENFHKLSKRPCGVQSRCKDCTSRYQEEYRANNSKKVKAQLEENPDAFGTHKICSMCKERQHRRYFHASSMTSDGKASNCHDCASLVAFVSREEARVYSIEWFEARPCEGCGEKNIKRLHGAHIDRKTKTFNPSDARSLKSRKAELAKCRSLCVKCHRMETAKEHGAAKDHAHVIRHKIVNEEKARRGKCNRCPTPFDSDHPYLFDFDHLPGHKKYMGISKMVATCKPIPKIQAEMKKCQLLCCYCHKEVTDDRRNNHWRMFCRFSGGETIESLAESFQLPPEKAEELVDERIHMRDVIERHYGQAWTDHVVWS